MPLTSPGNDDDTGENHQPTLRKNTAEPVEQTLKQNTSGPFYSALAAQRKADLRRRGSRKPRRMDSDRLRAWVLDSLRRGGARN